MEHPNQHEQPTIESLGDELQIALERLTEANKEVNRIVLARIALRATQTGNERLL
jgi:hypothetical protein